MIPELIQASISLSSFLATSTSGVEHVIRTLGYTSIAAGLPVIWGYSAVAISYLLHPLAFAGFSLLALGNNPIGYVLLTGFLQHKAITSVYWLEKIAAAYFSLDYGVKALYWGETRHKT